MKYINDMDYVIDTVIPKINESIFEISMDIVENKKRYQIMVDGIVEKKSKGLLAKMFPPKRSNIERDLYYSNNDEFWTMAQREIMLKDELRILEELRSRLLTARNQALSEGTEFGIFDLTNEEIAAMGYAETKKMSTIA